MSKVSTNDVIKYSAYFTYHSGYIKRSDDSDNCTANKVLDAIEFDNIREEDISDMSDRVKEWLAYINDSNNSGEYFDSIRSEVAKPMIEEIKIGLIASSFASMDKHKLSGKSKDKQSEYIGEEGDTVTFEITDYKFIKSGKSKFGNSSWYLYRIYSNKNVIIYFSNCLLESELKSHKLATATISKLSDFQGCKQTNVSNLKFE